MSETPSESEVAAFWNLARFHARLNSVPSYFGPTALEAVQPPAWSFGELPEEADAMVEALIDGAGTTTTTPVAAYDEAGVERPRVGTLGIVLDGAGHPRVLVTTTAVEVHDDSLVEELSVLWASDG